MILTIVNVFRAINATIAERAFTCVMREMVHTFCIVITRIEFGRTEGNFGFAVFAGETGRTTARIAFNAVHTRGIVLTLILMAVVNVRLTTCTSVSSIAFATKSALLQYRTGGIIAAWIAKASVNHELTVFTMIARLTNAIILALGQWLANGIVLTWERVACIAFRQNFIARLCFAYKIIGRGGQKQFVMHGFWFSTTCDSRFNVVQFHPIGKPTQ